MRKVFTVLMCCLMLFAMFSFSGCDSEKKDEAAETIEKYMTAQNEKDSDTIVDLLPPHLYEWYAEKYREVNASYTDEEIRDITKDAHSPIIKNIYYLKSMVPDEFIEQGGNYEDYFHIEYEILDNYTATKDEIAQFNEYNSKKFSCDVNAESISLICVRIEVIGEDGINYTETVWNELSFTCMKFDGKWYAVENAHSYDDKIWRTLDILEYVDRVEWIYEKITE